MQMQTYNIKEDERIDDLHRKGYRIIQSPNKFCFGMDAVLLAAFASLKDNEAMVDLGTGTGIIPILMEARYPGRSFIGLEIQQDSADMARRSMELNNLQDSIKIIEGDIKTASTIFKSSSIDVVTCNPPYMNSGHGLSNPMLPKAIARHEILCTLEDIVREVSKILKPSGRFYMVHRPFRLPEIISALKKYGLEPKRMQLVHPYVDKEPNMVLIEAVRNGKPMLKIMPPLIVYKEKGQYTKEIYDIYGYEYC